MSSRVVYVTANDTGVGKTVLTSLLARRLLDRGVAVNAIKPVCSGGRSDAVALRTALRNAASLDAINPWHFKLPAAPTLAARREKKKLRLEPVAKFIRKSAEAGGILLIEGAGGLLSPMGEGFSSLDLISKLRARPLIVCPNRLGVVNQISLVLKALPAAAKRQAVVILMEPAERDASTRDNARLVREFAGVTPILMPRVPQPASLETALKNPRLRRAVDQVIAALD